MADAYILAEQAHRDRAEIWRYIAKDNPIAADQTDVRFEDAFQKLADHPHMGHRRSDLTLKPLRFWSVHHYLIVYQPEEKPLRIIRILSGFRDVAGML